MKRRTLLTLAVVLLASPFSFADSFVEEDVKVTNNEAGINLAGTLTYPKEGAPKALIVMATGSGLQNRDEEVFGHKPFRTIAERLSGNGYAVLRMDDRGFGESEGAELLDKSTVNDIVTDIYSGLEFIGNRFPGIPKGVLGHSEGGTVAIKIASQRPGECAFLVTLAAPAWSGDSIVMSQGRTIATRLTGKWEGESIQRKVLDSVESDMPINIKRLVAYNIMAGTIGEAATLPQVQESLMAQLNAMLSPHYIDFLKYDPKEDITAISQPWLALNGDKDVQVLPENLQTISSLNPTATVELLEGHNHLFQHCTTGLVQEYPAIAEDISEETLDSILTWLNNRQFK